VGLKMNMTDVFQCSDSPQGADTQPH